MADQWDSWPGNSVIYRNWVENRVVARLSWPERSINFWRWLADNARTCRRCLRKEVPPPVAANLAQNFNIYPWMDVLACVCDISRQCKELELVYFTMEQKSLLQRHKHALVMFKSNFKSSKELMRCRANSTEKFLATELQRKYE